MNECDDIASHERQTERLTVRAAGKLLGSSASAFGLVLFDSGVVRFSSGNGGQPAANGADFGVQRSPPGVALELGFRQTLFLQGLGEGRQVGVSGLQLSFEGTARQRHDYGSFTDLKVKIARSGRSAISLTARRDQNSRLEPEDSTDAALVRNPDRCRWPISSRKPLDSIDQPQVAGAYCITLPNNKLRTFS